MDDMPAPTAERGRKCSKCRSGVLDYVKTKHAGVGTEKYYACSECEAELVLPPEGFLGTYLVVWALTSGGLGWLFFGPRSYPGPLTYLIIGGFIAVGGFSIAQGFYKHLKHPFVDEAVTADETPQEPLAKFWDMGLFKTPLVAIGLVAVFLAVAMGIGLLNDSSY